MRMIDCDIIGCKYLKTTCAICGRVVDEKRLPKHQEWISVKERPPKEYERVILYASRFPEEDSRKDCLQFIGYLLGQIDQDFDRRQWLCVWGDGWVPFQFEDITHWMPLPEAPK
jgi:hypothetical protein